MPFEYCQVCKRNHDIGRKHYYTKLHLANYGRWLQKQQDRVAAVRRCIRAPLEADIAALPASFWCAFCRTELPFSEAGAPGWEMRVRAAWLPSAHARVCRRGAVEHLATPEHKHAVHQFMHAMGKSDVAQPTAFVVDAAALYEVRGVRALTSACMALTPRRACAQPVSGEACQSRHPQWAGAERATPITDAAGSGACVRQRCCCRCPTGCCCCCRRRCP